MYINAASNPMAWYIYLASWGSAAIFQRCHRPWGLEFSHAESGEPDFSRGCYPVKKAWVESRRGKPFRSNPAGLGEESRRPPPLSPPPHSPPLPPPRPPSTTPLLVFSRPRLTRWTRRPDEMIVSEERERRPEQHEFPRATIRRPLSTIDRARAVTRTNERTNERMNERRNERTNARATRRDATRRNFLARDARLLRICEYILFNPFPRARD